MGVANLAGAGWHEFFDEAELGRFDEVPALAVGALWASLPATQDLKLKIRGKEQTYASIWQTSRLT